MFISAHTEEEFARHLKCNCIGDEIYVFVSSYDLLSNIFVRNFSNVKFSKGKAFHKNLIGVPFIEKEMRCIRPANVIIYNDGKCDKSEISSLYSSWASINQNPTRKPFSKKLYEKYDAHGKQATIELFGQILNYRHVPLEEELYKKGDVLFEDLDNKRVLVEVEVKKVGWKNDTFAFKDIHFAYKPMNKSEYFVSFNPSYTAAIVCKGSDLIKDENVIYKNTKNKDSGETTTREPFYQINLNNCDVYKKVYNQWIKQN